MPQEYRLFDPPDAKEWVAFASKKEARRVAEHSFQGEWGYKKNSKWKKRAPDEIRLEGDDGVVFAKIITIDPDVERPMFYRLYTGGDPQWEGKYFMSLRKAMRVMEDRWPGKILYWKLEKGAMSLCEEGTDGNECFGEIQSFRGVRPEEF